MSARELDLYEKVAALAAAMPFTEPDDDWDPFAFMEDKDGQTSMLSLREFMESDISKDALTEVVLPQAVKYFGAVKLVLVLSVWSSKFSKEEAEKFGKEGRPMRASLRPNREEHLWLMEYTPEGVGRHSYARIHRDEKKPPTLGEWEETPADSFSGRFVEPIVRAMKSV